MITYNQLCEQLGLVETHPSEQQCLLLQAWCEEHISTDIIYQGTMEEKQALYSRLAKNYLDVFLKEDKTSYSDKIQYASKNGFDRYLSQQITPCVDALNKPNTGGMTPLHLAAAFGHVHTVNVLLEHGADPTRLNLNKQSPLFSALLLPIAHAPECIANKEKIFRALYQAAPCNLAHQDSSGNTLFHQMASHHFVTLLQYMMPKDTAALLISNNAGKYPIHLAVLANELDIVKALMEIPGVMHLADSAGHVALHCAAQYGSPAIAGLCCQATDDLSIIDSEGKTPWMLAFEEHRTDILDIFREHGLEEPMEPPTNLM